MKLRAAIVAVGALFVVQGTSYVLDPSYPYSSPWASAAAYVAALALSLFAARPTPLTSGLASAALVTAGAGRVAALIAENGHAIPWPLVSTWSSLVVAGVALVVGVAAREEHRRGGEPPPPPRLVRPR